MSLLVFLDPYNDMEIASSMIMTAKEERAPKHIPTFFLVHMAIVESRGLLALSCLGPCNNSYYGRLSSWTVSPLCSVINLTRKQLTVLTFYFVKLDIFLMMSDLFPILYDKLIGILTYIFFHYGTLQVPFHQLVFHILNSNPVPYLEFLDVPLFLPCNLSLDSHLLPFLDLISKLNVC